MRFNSVTLSRRTLLARAGVVGASALALPPLLACQASGAVSSAIQPTATPSAGAVSSGHYRILWQKTTQSPPGVSASDLAAMAQGYGNALDAAYATEQQYMQQDLQALTQVSDTYSKSFTAALGKVGVDVAQLQADLEAFGKLTDAQSILTAKKALDAKYLAYYPKAYAAAGMDRDAIVGALSQQIRPRVSNPKMITPTLTGSQMAWGWTGQVNLDPPPAPPPCDTHRTYYPPYGGSITTIIDADAGTPTPTPSVEADLSSEFIVGDELCVFGSRQQLGGSLVDVGVDPTATHMHVEADVHLIEYDTRAIGALGYASAESLISLTLVRGYSSDDPPVAVDRRSLARSIAAVFTWDIKEFHGDLRFTLSVDHPIPAGEPRPYYAAVHAEIWVGCGSGIAIAGLQGYVERYRIFTTC